ncbi:MAG: hypothetical protein JWL77_6134 [Chthonomonadaceae bacterium]|nr:hypothetical protein [Chthonomonadaceae bacterium]
MGLPISYNSGCKLFRLGAALALCGLTVLARAEETQSQQAASAPYAGSIAKLQVTGSTEKFSVDADHADVQSVLKAIFNQANAQFTTDNSVLGQVTMRLSGQSLATTLDAVCKQLLIRYQKDAKGIYVFTQDAEAVKAAFTRVKDQNVLLRQQLRAYGLSLPEDTTLDAAATNAPGPNGPAGASAMPPNALRVSPGAGGGAGGFGGGGGRAIQPNLSEGNRSAGRGQSGADSMSKPLNRSVGGAKGDAGPSGNAAAKDDLRLNYLTAQSLAEMLALNPQTNTLLNPNDYLAWLKQNGLVYINTGGNKAPVTEVLQELARQSNTPILIDASVPRGPKFSLQGYITPRTLPEALQVLTQSTRLNWRWVGGSIYVDALPDFQIFLNSTSPRVIFGNSALPTTQQNGVQGQQFGGTNGAYAQPGQTPLPITNGDKKTP